MSKVIISKYIVNSEGELIKAIHDRIKIDITRKNSCNNNISFEHRTIKNADGSPLRLRRVGNTQTWKWRPDEFSIPVKYGLKFCLNITQDNADHFYIVG